MRIDLTTGADISALVEAEIAKIDDPALVMRIRELQVTPYAVDRDWDYGTPGQLFTCWTVLEHRKSNTGIAYASEGFGPADPWGLVFLSGELVGIGMDSGWFRTLEGAVRDGMFWEGSDPEGYEVA